MGINRSSDVMYGGGTDVRVPSGFEVESASLHVPIETGFAPPQPARRTWKEKLTWKQQATSRLKTVSKNVNGSMRSNATMWTGVAAGAGLGIGLIGRFLHHRSHHHKSLPAIVIIDAAC